MATENSCELGTPKFYALCALGGMISCGTTHTLIVPLDLVKCRMQVDPVKFTSLPQGLKLTLTEEGPKALVRGWAPTLVGYSLQGVGKFGFYEGFKIFYGGLMGEENAYLYKTSLYLIASASAEFFADIFLCPFEMMKVRIQTIPGYAANMREAYGKMKLENGAFFAGLKPLWMRQIPYTMCKFSIFERTVEYIYANVWPTPRSQCGKSEQLCVTFISGYIAGVLCAIVSHPADSVVSVLNKTPEKGAMGVLKELGPKGVWKGLGARIVMIGTLTALQWFIYDSVKVALRLPRPPPPEMPESLKRKLATTESINAAVTK